MKDVIPSNETCVIIPLTIRLGPKSGTTKVYCACGWDRTYKTRRGAIRCAREHIELTTRDAKAQS